MRFVCDANIGSIIAQALTDAGHDVLRAIHVLPDADDLAILAYASSEDRILITCDSDFGEHVYLRKAATPPAIIYIRYEPEDVRDIVPRLMAVLDFEALRNHMTVIDDRRDRRTPFPGKSRNNG